MLTLLLLTCFAGATGAHRRRRAVPARLDPAAVGRARPGRADGARRSAVDHRPGSRCWSPLATGVGAALSPPTLPSAARLLRGTAGVVCAVTGAAGVAGSLATRTGTLTALVTVLVGGRDRRRARTRPGGTHGRLVRRVGAPAFALPVDRARRGGPAAAAGRVRRAGRLRRARRAWRGCLAARRGRRAEAGVVEMCASVGATFALLLALGSARHAAAVLTIWGLLLGGAALRRDRPPDRRAWLVRAALAAEVGATWLLLYSVEVGPGRGVHAAVRRRRLPGRRARAAPPARAVVVGRLRPGPGRRLPAQPGPRPRRSRTWCGAG